MNNLTISTHDLYKCSYTLKYFSSRNFSVQRRLQTCFNGKKKNLLQNNWSPHTLKTTKRGLMKEIKEDK